MREAERCTDVTNAVFGKADGAAVLAEQAPPLTGGGGKGKVGRIRLNRALTYEGRHFGTTIVTAVAKAKETRVLLLLPACIFFQVPVVAGPWTSRKIDSQQTVKSAPRLRMRPVVNGNLSFCGARDFPAGRTVSS
jgi:hypothetical protein